jgi:hypothetical protein
MGGGVLIIPHSYKYKILLKISKKKYFSQKKHNFQKKIKKNFQKKNYLPENNPGKTIF